MHGPSTDRQAGELILRFGHLTDAVQESFRLDTAKPTAGKIARIALVALVRLGGELVRARRTDVADQFLEVVFVFGEFLAKLLQQLGIGSGIADANIVHLLDDALAKEVSPDNVGQVGGEVGILRRSQPLGEHLTPVFAGHVRRVAA